MSTLWTPGGEHPVGRDPRARGESPGDEETTRGPARVSEEPFGPGAGTSEEELVAAHLDELRQQLLSAPAEVVVANHAYGLFELAAMHLAQRPPNLEDARLAIDAMSALVEGLAGRLGEPEKPLREALAQIRLAYVQIGGASGSADGEVPPEGS